MSVQALNWAFNQKVESSTAKFILVCLSNYANESMKAYPSVATISEMTGLDRKTVISGLDRLLSEGFISDSGERVGFTKSVKIYQLKCTLQTSSPKNGTVPKTEASSPVFPYKQSRFSVKQSQKRDTEPSGTVREPKGEPEAPSFPKDFKIQIDAATEEREKLKNRGASITPTGVDWHDEACRQEFLALGKKIKTWKQKLLSLNL